jgi:uncharacterized membrane protein
MATEQRVESRQFVNGLGWFSIGLGLAELAAPKTMARLIGVKPTGKSKNILRIYGARELGAGIGILSQSNVSKWLWARFAGDILDLCSLGKAMTSHRNDRARAIAATAAVAGVTVADARCAMQSTRAKSQRPARKHTAVISSSITIARNAGEVYQFWRNFNRLSEILDRLESVQILDNNRSHWKVALPGGRSLEWDAEITDDQPDTRIAWRSLSASAPHSGDVRFEPAAGGRGTKVTVKIHLGLGTGLGKFVGFVPEQHVNIALHNLKQLMEVGEIAKSDASIHRGMHPAQPPKEYSITSEQLRAGASA